MARISATARPSLDATGPRSLRFCLLGDQPQSYFGANQKLFDTSGRQYGANTEASMWMNSSIQSDINPGNSVQVKEAFDVPPGTQPSVLEVHDSMMSGGAMVHL
jgi:hypothetical protein